MDIVALHRQGLSLRAIARQTGLHRDTVKKYVEGHAPPSYRQGKRKESVLDPYKPVIRELLEQDDYQATWLFERMKAMGYAGGYDTLKDFARTVKDQKSRLAYMRFETQPGFQAQVDWADFPIEERDGKRSKIYLFALVLGYSRAMYAECMERCTLESFMDGHIRAFRYLGGVPAEIVYDNMKHVVLGREGTRVVFNTEFLHFAHHYGFRPRACPPYSPWVKGKVERPIRYIEERFWRGYGFDSIERTAKDLLEWLSETANQRVHSSHGEPVVERWSGEKPSLVPLPPADYDTSLKVYRKVYRDCLISFGANRYAVPHRAVGKTLLLKIKGNVLRIFDDGEFLIKYELPSGKGKYVGLESIYRALRDDPDQAARRVARKKACATRGLSSGTLYPEVARRALAEYEELSGGGVQWMN
ncbi:MAG: IS21 family transposase [Syntrophobacteraceae bacterium]